MARLTIRIDLNEKSALGPGKARLLELINEKGSIRGAAAAMQMSYRQAWQLLREVESMMGRKVVAAETGGVDGGGTKLTKLGRTVLSQYRAIERRASRAVGAELASLVEMAKGTAGAHARGHGSATASRRKPMRKR